MADQQRYEDQLSHRHSIREDMYYIWHPIVEVLKFSFEFLLLGHTITLYISTVASSYPVRGTVHAPVHGTRYPGRLRSLVYIYVYLVPMGVTAQPFCWALTLSESRAK